MITARAVDEIEALAALEPQWKQLWERCPEATPFQHPAWLVPWCRHFLKEGLSSVALQRDGHLVGLLPSFIASPRGEGPRPLALLGQGISDYLDALVDPGDMESVIAALSTHLAERGAALDLDALRPGSPLLRLPPPRAGLDEIDVADVCPVVTLPDRGVGLGAVIPRETLRNVRRARARAADLGRITERLADASSRAELVAALFALHGARWGQRGQQGVLGEGAIRAFHDEASAALLAAGMLRLLCVEVDDRPLGALLAFFARGRAYLYLQGFDPAFERLSPGLIVTAAAVEQAAREGLRVIDFLRGREPYKYLWGAHDEITYRRTVRPAGFEASAS